jgi:hypothetical protein
MSDSLTVAKDGVDAPDVLPGSTVLGKIFLIATELTALPVLYSHKYKVRSSAVLPYRDTCPLTKAKRLFWAEEMEDGTFINCQRCIELIK